MIKVLANVMAGGQTRLKMACSITPTAVLLYWNDSNYAMYFLTVFFHYGNKWFFKCHHFQIIPLENTAGVSIKDKELLNKSDLPTCHMKQFLCQVADVYDGA